MIPPKKRIGELPYIDDAEHKKITWHFNDNNASFDKRCIQELVEEQVRKSPDLVAVADGEHTITYNELNRRSNQLAHYLRNACHMGPGKVVGLCIDRSVDMIIGLLGIVKSGAAYLAIDPTYPKERVLHMLKDSKVDTVLTDRPESELFENYKGVFIDLKIQESQLRNQPKGNPALRNRLSDTVYIIYTSGSTGMPNGAMLSHGILSNLVQWQNKKTSIDASLNCLQFTSVNFCVSFQEIITTLGAGGTVHLIGDIERRDIAYLTDFIAQHNIEVLYLPFSYLNFLFNTTTHRWQQGYRHSLKHIITAGEQLKISSGLKDFLTQNPNVQLHNHYGSSEMHVVASYTLDAHALEKMSAPPVGKPVANTAIYILNENQQPVPIGVWGELYIAGSEEVAGYIHNEALTKAKLTEHQTLSPQKKLYRSGDMGRWLEDGNIEIRGRVDDQVKVRGFRVELGDVESKILSIPHVEACVVVVKKDKQQQNYLVAYIVIRDTTVLEIKRQLTQMLPQYMVPHCIVLEALPLMPNGKVDREKLPEPREEDLGLTYAPPRNKTEEQLTDIWAVLLQTEKNVNLQIGIHNNFFELGGHSLLATQMVSAVRKKMGKEIAIKEVFTLPTIAELALYISETEKTTTLPAITAQKRPKKIPLSFAQERLWFIDGLSGSTQYHMPAVLKLNGHLDTLALESAFTSIVERHESLRTVFVEEKGNAYQQIMSSANWKMEYVEEKAGQKQRDEQIAEIIHSPFDLSKDYMLRTVLFRQNRQEHLLVVVMHHIASDGWSLPIFIQEVKEYYRAVKEGAKVNLSPLPIQYADYAIWQHKYLTPEVLDNQMDYWAEKLQGIGPLNLSTDFPRPLIQSTKGNEISSVIDKKLTEKLNSLSQEKGVTLFMTLLSAFKVLLYRYTGQKDICVGSPVANRTQQETESLIGFFVNTLPLRSTVKNDLSFTDLLAQVKETTLEAYDHQNIPFEKIVDKVTLERDTSRSPVFQVMFALQNNRHVPISQFGDVTLSPEPLSAHHAKFDITFNIEETSSGLDVSIEYCNDLFLPETIERMVGHFQTLLSSIVAKPDQEISRLAILGKAEEKQLLVDFNDTQVDYPKEKTIVDLFENQAAQTPNSVAVVFENKSLTYRQLNNKANQLAHYLIGQGIKQESLVAICMDRSLEMIIGILGILKAGGAYVPIDVEYPPERIRYILEDSKTTIIITGGQASEMLSENNKALTIVNLGEDWSAITEKHKTQPGNRNTP